MSSARVIKLCDKCGFPNKIEVDFLGNIKIVDVVCKCSDDDKKRK